MKKIVQKIFALASVCGTHVAATGVHYNDAANHVVHQHAQAGHDGRKSREALIEEWANNAKKEEERFTLLGKYADVYKQHDAPFFSQHIDGKTQVSLGSQYSYASTAHNSSGSQGNMLELLFGSSPVTVGDLLLASKVVNTPAVVHGYSAGVTRLSPGVGSTPYMQDLVDGFPAGEVDNLAYNRYFEYVNNEKVSFRASSHRVENAFAVTHKIGKSGITIGLRVPIVYAEHNVKAEMNFSDKAKKPGTGASLADGLYGIDRQAESYRTAASTASGVAQAVYGVSGVSSPNASSLAYVGVTGAYPIATGASGTRSGASGLYANQPSTEVPIVMGGYANVTTTIIGTTHGSNEQFPTAATGDASLLRSWAASGIHRTIDTDTGLMNLAMNVGALENQTALLADDVNFLALTPGGQPNTFMRRYGQNPDLFLKDIFESKGISEFGGSSLGLGDMELSLASEFDVRGVERANAGLKLTLPTAQQASTGKFFAPELGNGGHAALGFFASALIAHNGWINLHGELDCDIFASAEVNLRTPKKIQYSNTTGDYATLSTDLMSFGDRVYAVNGSEINDFDTPFAGVADNVARLRRNRGSSLHARIGNLFTFTQVKRASLDVYYDLRAKLKDSFDGDASRWDTTPHVANSQQIGHTAGATMAYQFSRMARGSFGLSHVLAGHNVKKDWNFSASLQVTF